MRNIRRPEDPILSPEEMARDAGISISTWRREYRDALSIIQVSPRRISSRQSEWRRVLNNKRAGGKS
jgi:hypothetical protein